MANTKSAKKNIRASARKRSHNNMWDKRFKSAVKVVAKAINAKEAKEVVQEKFKALQKALDKAAKEKVIHKNKASRVKSRYARKIAALILGEEEKPKVGSVKPKSTKPTKSRADKKHKSK